MQSGSEGGISIDAGVNWVRWTAATRSGSTATLHGDEDNWACFAQWQDAKGYVVACPHNEELTTVSLQDVDGRWLVSDSTWKFAPGRTP